LVQGELLDGPGARAYSWVEMPAEDGQLSLREQYREQAYRVTLRLARLLARASQYRQAVLLLRSLLEAEPLLEDVSRGLFRCHAAVGDLQALLDEEQRLRTALRRAHAAYGGSDDDEPAPEPATAALFADLREDLELRGSVVPA